MKKNLLLTLPILALIPACSGGASSQESAIADASVVADASDEIIADASAEEEVSVIETSAEAIADGTATTNELYAFEAATSIGLLSEINSTPTLSLISPKFAAASDTTVEELKGYLPSVESALLGEDILLSSTIEASDLEGYTTKMTVSYTDIALNASSFTMYFNETILVDDDDDDWDDHHHHGHDDQEQESWIDGIVILGEDTYTIRGEKEIDGDEVEVKFIYQISDTTYVMVEQEKEAGEQEFAYKLIENGATSYSYSLEVEHNEVELKVKDKVNLSKLTMKFDLHIKDGTTYIRAKVNDGTTKSVVLFQKVVDELTGLVSWNVISNQ